MQIGFINFNTDEKKRVAKLMQLLQESEAIEELGIGRVRDHFSNTLFPGTSTLQHHAKYFAVLPSLYYHAAYKDRRFNSLAEVNRYIKEAEVQITRQLAEDSDGNPKADVKGITGIDTYKEALKDYRKFVKYDPMYIYGSGLARYDIIPDTAIERLILELNNKYFADPHNKMMKSENDETDDTNDLTGNKQLIRTCGEPYHFFEGKTMSLVLTEKEANFLRDRIHATCQESMLSFLMERNDDIPARTDYYDVDGLLQNETQDFVEIYQKSVLFSKLIYLIDWRYNYCYYNSFERTNEAASCDDSYKAQLAQFKKSIADENAYQSLFEYTRPIDGMLTTFCELCYQAIRGGMTEIVDQKVKEREHTVKRDRSKIGNKAYKDIQRGNPVPNTFRWETVRTMVNEIRNPQ